MIYLVWIIIFVGVCTFTDLREKKIYLLWCMMNAAAGVIINLILKEHSISDLGVGATIGMAFIVIAICTKEKIGIGDGVVMITIGLITGGVVSFAIILWSFVVCTFISSIALITAKMKWNSSVPFMPYMLMGSIITLCLQGV